MLKMIERSWRWYLLGDNWDYSQKKKNTAKDCYDPASNMGNAQGHPIKAPSGQPTPGDEEHKAAERNFGSGSFPYRSGSTS
jgi:hypothetical protein